MPVIDADTHVIETERTWEYMEGPDKAFRPEGITVRGKEFWLVDGRVLPRRQNVGAQTTLATREMGDVAARLEHMNELGVDIHVLYPTAFLEPMTRRPEIELALTRAYNRWLADIYEQGKGRLLWAAVLPLLSLNEAVEEVRWARQHGAVSVFVRGQETSGPLWDPYYFPLYEELVRLNMPIGIHAGINHFEVDEAARGEAFRRFKLPVVGTFHALLNQGLPQRFPGLRIGFIETGAQWVPYALHDLAKRLQRRGEQMDEGILARSGFYVTVQTDDDLDYVLRYAGEDTLMIGSDYGHSDNAAELEALRKLRDGGELPARVVDKILGDNPARFYALE
jgi:uncharacterized protein